MARKRFELRSPLTGTFEEQFPELSGKRLSLAKATASRAAMYSGVGRSEFYRGREYDETDPVVFDYRARDDDRTCPNCLEAERNGPYLAGQGAFPGTVCSGGGRCRCNRVPRRDPAAYARLTGA